MRKAFTLVELAIVMTIIGLLIGGILKGQELLENARVTSTVAQIKSYETALTGFSDIYSGLPGDLAKATEQLPGCTGAVGCVAGNGNGIIGVKTGFNNVIMTPALIDENAQFWKHLALANLITGINTSATTLEFNESHPSSKIGGGFLVTDVTTDLASADPGSWMVGHVLVMRNIATGGYDNWRGYSPNMVARLDRKMDDGIATTGSVHAVSINWTEGCGRLNVSAGQGASGYDETRTDKTCQPAFSIGG